METKAHTFTRRCLLLISNRKLSACVYVCTAVLGVRDLLLNKPIMSEGELFVVGFWPSLSLAGLRLTVLGEDMTALCY